MTASDGEELEFYECEENFHTPPGTGSPSTRLLKRISTDHLSPSFRRNPSITSINYDDHKLETELRYPPLSIERTHYGSGEEEEEDYSRRTPPGLRIAYQEIREREKQKLLAKLEDLENYSSSKKYTSGANKLHGKGMSEVTTTRDMAVNIVESVFVVAEFIFWQVTHFKHL
jgi:hypothetical protein